MGKMQGLPWACGLQTRVWECSQGWEARLGVEDLVPLLTLWLLCLLGCRDVIDPTCPAPQQAPSPLGGGGWRAYQRKPLQGGVQTSRRGWVGDMPRSCPASSPLLSCVSGAGRLASVPQFPSERREVHHRPPRVVGRSHKPVVWALPRMSEPPLSQGPGMGAQPFPAGVPACVSTRQLL